MEAHKRAFDAPDLELHHHQCRLPVIFCSLFLSGPSRMDCPPPQKRPAYPSWSLNLCLLPFLFFLQLAHSRASLLRRSSTHVHCSNLRLCHHHHSSIHRKNRGARSIMVWPHQCSCPFDVWDKRFGICHFTIHFTTVLIVGFPYLSTLPIPVDPLSIQVDPRWWPLNIVAVIVWFHRPWKLDWQKITVKLVDD